MADDAVTRLATKALDTHGRDGLHKGNVLEHDGLTCDTVGALLDEFGLTADDQDAIYEALIDLLPEERMPDPTTIHWFNHPEGDEPGATPLAELPDGWYVVNEESPEHPFFHGPWTWEALEADGLDGGHNALEFWRSESLVQIGDGVIASRKAIPAAWPCADDDEETPRPGRETRVPCQILFTVPEGVTDEELALRTEALFEHGSIREAFNTALEQARWASGTVTVGDETLDAGYSGYSFIGPQLSYDGWVRLQHIVASYDDPNTPWPQVTKLIPELFTILRGHELDEAAPS